MAIPDVILIEPHVFHDSRGFFFESFNQKRFDQALGRHIEFVQDNHSRSHKNVLRGLHYQLGQAQGKLIRVVEGEIFDVTVDLRRSSATFGKWMGIKLSDKTHQQLWIPEGFAHGFLVLSEFASVLYKTTDYYTPECERCLSWDDPTVNIAWPLEGSPILSEKDQVGLAWGEAEVFF